MSTLFEQQQIMEKFFQLTMLTQLTEHSKGHGDRNVGRNIFRGQGKILLILSEQDNLSQKELSNRLEMTPQSTAEFVTKLAKRGLVEKNKSPHDGRISLIKLTDAGRANIAELEQVSPDGLKYITDDEKKQLLAILTKLVDGMRADFDNADDPNGLFATVQRKMAEHMVNEHMPNN